MKAFAIGPVMAIRTFRDRSAIRTYYRTLVDSHRSEPTVTDPEGEALREISGALTMFAPTVQQRWQTVLPELS